MLKRKPTAITVMKIEVKKKLKLKCTILKYLKSLLENNQNISV